MLKLQPLKAGNGLKRNCNDIEQSDAGKRDEIRWAALIQKIRLNAKGGQFSLWIGVHEVSNRQQGKNTDNEQQNGWHHLRRLKTSGIGKFCLTSDRRKEWLIRQRAIHVGATCMSVTRIRTFVIVL